MSRVGLGRERHTTAPGTSKPANFPWDMPDQFGAAERIAQQPRASPATTSTRSVARVQRKAAQAWAEGRFDREIAPVEVPVLGEDGQPTGETQRRQHATRGLRETTAGGLAKLKPVLPDGIHTAGQQLADLRRRGRRALDERGQAPRPPGCGRGRGSCAQALVGSDPYYHLDGPVDATTPGAREGRA